MSTSRRNLLKGAAAVGGLAAFATGYAHTAANAVTGLVSGSSGTKPRHPIHGNAPEPEFTVDPLSGKLEPNPRQRVCFTMCLGCNTHCGVRVRVDNETGRILRVAGNPYHPLSADPHLPMGMPVRKALASLSGAGDAGLANRSTACGRGNAVPEQITNPYRVLSCLKRVGPRGGGKWEEISFETLIEEVCEGGDLFGEGPVEGLRSLRDLTTPLDPNNPEYGPKANQLAVMHAVGDGREHLLTRFALGAFGTRNYANHESYCGYAMRAGYAALANDFQKNPHFKPDFANAEFAIFMGSAPGNAGKPFKRQGTLVAKARTDGKLKYVVIDPTLTNASNLAAEGRNRWLPITPGADGAFAMAMIRWIIENERYDARYLALPGKAAMEAAGEASWSNATHLVVTQKDHPRAGRFLRGTDLGLPLAAVDKAAAYGPGDAFMARDAETGALVTDASPKPAQLFFAGTVDTPQGPVEVKTSLQILKEEALRFTLDEYSAACSIPVATIEELAHEFTSHGKKAVVDAHGGMMAPNGFSNAWAVLMLNVLVGNWNWKGGTSPGAGQFPSVAPGPRYNLVDFPGKVEPRGVFISRNKFPYEKTSEFKRRKDAGENPYPTKAPWYPVSPSLLTEFFTSHFNGYPYKLKALISLMCNPLYGHTGLKAAVGERMKDPKDLPLYIALDGFINETNCYADYIVPDSVQYESWGWARIWNGYLTKASTARWPVVEPRQAKTATGQPITQELFFIEVAKRLALPGFGDGAIPDGEGNLHALHTPEDFYLRAGANVAFGGQQPAPDATDEDIRLSGVGRILPLIQATVKAEEVSKVAFVYSRGGRFEPYAEGWKDEKLKWGYLEQPANLYNEAVGTAKNSMTGKRYKGVPTWTPPCLSDGTPLAEAFPKAQWPFVLTPYKSNMQNSYSIGSSKLRQIHPNNPVGINAEDAQRLRIKSGDRIRITTPGGSVVATALVRNGVAPGAISVEHGFGHTELGARRHVIGGKSQPETGAFSAGINLNDLGFGDPKRQGCSTLADWMVGSSARTALPAKIIKL